jgi:hypothetical protein
MRGWRVSLRIYLDDCAYSRRLREILKHDGHDVAVPGDADPPLTGADDDAHFAHARTQGRVVLTYNAMDFLALHRQAPDHPGILVVYQDNDPSKDMTYAEIGRAIANLVALGEPVAGGFWVLNRFRW